MCFLDASKAFDRINHSKLFMKLLQRGVPKIIIRILMYWYSQQTMRVKWGCGLSSPFHVSNGVRQGGLLSPALFNVYMNDLSDQLSLCSTGCLIGNSVINHLMYADDLAIVSPCSAGLQQLLKVCTQYGLVYDIKFNAKKSNVMIVRSKEDKKMIFPDFYLCDSPLMVCKEVKYLGHIITDDLYDDRDMYRQRRKLYAQANLLLRKFSMCSPNVKCSLFKAFCTPMYTAHLWCKYKKSSYQKLTVAYNDTMRLLMQVPRWSSASYLFAYFNVPGCDAVLRNLMYKFMRRLDCSQNGVIDSLVNPIKSSVRFSSKLRRHWRQCLYIL